MLKAQDNKSEFKLRLAGVANGKHSFSIVCNKTFFDNNEISDILDGSVNVLINMDKSDKMLRLDFHYTGTVTVECSRCLDPVLYPIDFKSQLLVNLVQEIPEDFENDDEIWMINEKDYDLDIYQFVFESIILSLPSQIIHPDDSEGNSTCNSDFLNTLAQYMVDEPFEDEEEEKTDPRWDALKNIKFDE
ncbi:MAG TPA: DUF177 domain-containing protein [Bacteroidales bacterium]|nr:DUF177 domain-containing protein [Bacteroidales bacterium]HPS70915.1 DUF177 domain-containing protein [Bacteroidales bacterium]